MMAESGKGCAPIFVVMGISGSGKSTLANALAERLGLPFLEGDDLHPAANVERMRSGLPLRHEERLPWLKAVANHLAHWQSTGRGGVASCSALKRDYRNLLRKAVDGLRFIYLEINASEAAARVTRRPGHFMPCSLVESQFQTLEAPHGEGDVLVLDGMSATSSQIERILSQGI